MHTLLQLGTMGVDQGYETIRLKCPVKGLSIAPETVSAEVLKSLISDAERYEQSILNADYMCI
jgi:hypothetical protein